MIEHRGLDADGGNGSRAAQYEHTMVITEDRPILPTAV
jgi:hypothetical protein